MHILPVLAGLEVLVLGGGPDIFFFVHLNWASNCTWLAPAAKTGFAALSHGAFFFFAGAPSTPRKVPGGGV